MNRESQSKLCIGHWFHTLRNYLSI